MIRHHLSGCFGSGAIDEAAYKASLKTLQDAFAATKQKAKDCPQTSALFAMARQTKDLPELRSLAADIKKQFDHVVVCGSGGSGLSGRIFAQLNMGRCQADMAFIENIDPDRMDTVLGRINIKRSCFIIISKSGTTVETLGQFFVLREKVHAAGGDVTRQFIIITMQNDNPLRSTAEADGMQLIEHPSDIGGRFSAFTAVGLLPAAICGLDIAAIRAGACTVLDEFERSRVAADVPSAQSASLHHAAINTGRNISVMWPYGERLSGYAAWYRQSWAESLGKNGKGSTPVMAIGTTDQHSQLQLFLDGPKDKLFHIVTWKRKGTGEKISAPKALAHLNGNTLGDIMAAQQQATIDTLIRNQRPVRVIELDEVGETSFGALLMTGMLEIWFTAALLGVNPYDQPAVEESKQLAREHLRKGVA